MDDSFFVEMGRSVPDVSDDELMEYFLFEDGTYYDIHSLLSGLLRDLLSSTSAEFYTAQREQMEAWWDYTNLLEDEKNYWREQVSHIQYPMVYQCSWVGTSRLFDFYEILIRIIPMFTGLCLCRIFSEEHRMRVEALIFSSKKSRAPLYIAKVLSGLTFVALAAVLIISVILSTYIAILGGEGFDAYVQMFSVVCALPTTVGNVILAMLAWVVVYALLCGSVTMLLSLLTHSSSVAFIASVMFMGYVGQLLG